MPGLVMSRLPSSIPGQIFPLASGMVHLPQEIVDHVIAQLALDETASLADLGRAALISRAWRVPSQKILYRSQLFCPPHKRLLSRLAWFQEGDGQHVVHHVKEVQFWRLDCDTRRFCAYWNSVLETFPRVQDVSIQFHDAALQGPLGGPNVQLPTFSSVTTLRLSNVAFATCHNLLVLISTLPNVTSLHMDRENWACKELLDEESGEQSPGASHVKKEPMCNGASCPLLPLRNIVIDCTGGLDLLECAVRHTDLSKLISLNVALPVEPQSDAPANWTAFLMGIPLPQKPDFPAQEEQIRSLLYGMDALKTMVFRLPSKVVCNPIIPESTPSLRHFALHYLRLDCFEPSAARPTLSCVPDALAALESPCLETVNITFSLADLAQLDHVPWDDVDCILADPDAFPVLRECACNVVFLAQRGSHAVPYRPGPESEGRSPKVAAIAAIAAAMHERLPSLSARGVVGVYEAEEDFIV